MSRLKVHSLCAACALTLLVTTACKDSPTSPAANTANVRFTVTSPFCSPNTFTIDFAINGTDLGTETIKDKGSSKTYTVPAGTQTLGAYIGSWHLSKDTTVTLIAGQTFVRDLNLYCS